MRTKQKREESNEKRDYCKTKTATLIEEDEEEIKGDGREKKD